MRLQEKLLRLVEYGEFERVGGQETLQVDVRVIAATNADLRALASRGEFRHDLLDRLSFDIVHLPALRHRQEDIPELAEHFAIQMSAELGWELFPGFTRDAMRALQAYHWPGNVRELKNAVERSLYRWGDGTSEVADIVLDPFVSPYAAALPEMADLPQPAPETAAPPPPPQSFTEQVATLERRLLNEALEANGHNQRRTAEALELSYDQLRGLVRKYDLGGRRRAAG
jgi:psp operon transcriptional activator